ncbi:MAG: HEAT repeat domain-containing protein [Candidatus Eisenbacteria bacterium]|nr:HEAT repeat domain-containing protein [Candidatus Eisenbacteria bacterium]
MWVAIVAANLLLFLIVVFLAILLGGRTFRAKLRQRAITRREKLYSKLVDETVAGTPLKEIKIPRKKAIDREVLEKILKGKLFFIKGEERERVTRILDEKGFVDDYIRELSSQDMRVRARACEVLGELRLLKAADPLRDLLSDENEEVSETASRALGKIMESSRALAETLIENLVRELKSPNRWMLLNTAQVIKSLGEMAVDELIVLLRSSEPRERYHTALILGELKNYRTVEPLMRALADIEPKVRSAAAEALGKIGDLRAVAEIAGLLEDDHPSVRVRAAEALGRLGDTRAVDALKEAARGAETQVKWEAVRALHLLDGTGGIRALEDLALLEEDSIREQVAEAFEMSGLMDQYLKQIGLSETEKSERAEKIITKLAEAGVLSPIESGLAISDPGTRKKIAGILGDTLELLLKTFQSGKREEVVKAVEILLRMAHLDLVTKLNELLRESKGEFALLVAEACHTLVLILDSLTELAETETDENVARKMNETVAALRSKLLGGQG